VIMFHDKQLFEKGFVPYLKGRNKELFVLLGMICISLLSLAPHPYHVSYTEIEYKKESKTLTFSIEVFTDDLENAIKLTYQPEKFFLGSDSLKPETEILIQKYILDKTTLLIDGIVLKGASFLPSECNPDRTVIYFQYNDLPPFSSFSFYSEVLLTLFKDQQNIVEFRNGTSKEKALLNSDKKSVTWKIK